VPTKEFVRPIEPASGTFKREPFVVNPNQIFESNDPLVRKFPHLFQPLEATRQRPDVESMTAAPGEQRGA
jgi:hypothetical protein